MLALIFFLALSLFGVYVMTNYFGAVFLLLALSFESFATPAVVLKKAVTSSVKQSAKLARNLKKTKFKIMSPSKGVGNKVDFTGLSRFKPIDGPLKDVVKVAPNKIGVYVVRLNGKIKYIGRAIENRPGQRTSGLRKRLQEHFRGAKAGNKKIFENRDDVDISMVRCESVQQARHTESSLIRKYDTVRSGWNLRYEK